MVEIPIYEIPIYDAEQTDNRTRMVLGQLRKVFDVRWLQCFDNGQIQVSLHSDYTSRGEVIRFMRMYGYEFVDEDDEAGWDDIYFE